MSAASPADPGPPAMNGPRGAAVIDIRTRTSRTATEGRGRHVTNPHPSPAPEPGPAPGRAQRELAEHVEMTFNAARMTLTNQKTADAYTLALTVARGLIEGAEAQGVLSETQRRELDRMLEGAAAAPRLL